MIFKIDFQYLPKSSPRPLDQGEVRPITVADQTSAVIPNVGDYVVLVRAKEEDKRPKFWGRVRSRLFHFVGDDECFVNLVVEEAELEVFYKLISE